jgi:hypothetical protein
LEKTEQIKIEKLEIDLQDGKVLIQLLETLYQTTLVSSRSKLDLKFVISSTTTTTTTHSQIHFFHFSF